MPHTEVVPYREGDKVPLLEWLDTLPQRARDDCLERLRLLERFGHELRRPHADYVRDGIYELRARREGIQYRMLYFHHGQLVVVVSHGLVKRQAALPPREIKRAMDRLNRFKADPKRHTFRPGT